MSGWGLFDDYVGFIWVVNIEGVDFNMCCGIYVSNFSDF